MEKNMQNLVRTADSISASFMKLRFVTISCIVLTFLSVVFSVGYSIYSVRSLGDKVYVIDKGQVSLATRSDAAVTRRDEIENLAVNVHRLFFNVSPVQSVVNDNVNEVLAYSADQTWFQYFTDLQESGFYQRIVQSNSIQEIEVDSVKVNMSVYPYPVRVYSSKYILRQSVMKRSQLITEMTMIDVPRDAFNLNGLKIGNFRVVSDKDIESKKRNRNY